MSFRELRESAEFAAEKAKVEPNVKRLDEMLLTTTWALAKDPEYFPVVAGTRKLRAVTTPPFAFGSVRILYRFDDITVPLLWIEPCDECDEDWPDPFDE